MKKIRSSVKAIILENNKLLTIKKKDEIGIFYILPGGGQEFGEILIDTVKREVREEVGASIFNEQLVFVREYIGSNHEYALRDKYIHIVEHIFLCSIDEEEICPIDPDDDQVGIEWIPIKDIANLRFYPKDLVKRIIQLKYNTNREIYVGDVN